MRLACDALETEARSGRPQLAAGLRVRTAGLCAAVLLASSQARADTPLSYLEAHGDRAYPINSLLWGLIVISLAVIVMAIVLVLMGVMRGRLLPANALPGRTEIGPAHGGLAWIVAGVGATTLVLLGAVIWTVVALAKVSLPPSGQNPVRLQVVGHQWWWEIRYLDDEPSRTFRSANEIHIPVGRPVQIELNSADVIHSFWVPALTGKTDLVPGQTNSTWLSASKPGVYRGQCGEYCGKQHAHMALQLVAHDREEFKAWWDRQLEPAPAAGDDEAMQDQATFVLKCGACHTVRGTPAGGILGPDLSHLMRRRTLAGATLPNTAGYLSAWIADPQHFKPGNLMPRLDVSGPELTRIRRFLERLE